VKYFDKMYEVSKTKKYSKLNLFVTKMLLVAIFLVPTWFFIRDWLLSNEIFKSLNGINIFLWFFSVVSFIFGIISIIFSFKGLKYNLGNVLAYIINIVIGFIVLIALSGLVFMPHMYIIF